MAAAEASFRTSMEAMSCGLIKFNGLVTPKELLSMIKPSTTNNGVVPDLKLPIPRMIMFWAAPGSPLVAVTFTPEILP